MPTKLKNQNILIVTVVLVMGVFLYMSQCPRHETYEVNSIK